MFKSTLRAIAAATVLGGAVATALAGDAMPGGDYKKVSDLVELPEFIPGMGTLYVQPDTLPAGPFLAYDANEELVSTVYMVPLSAMQAAGEIPGSGRGQGECPAGRHVLQRGPSGRGRAALPYRPVARVSGPGEA